MATIEFSKAAQENIEETGIEPADDAQRLRDGDVTVEELLAECLDGADEDRVQGWRDYVEAVVAWAKRDIAARIILDNGGGLILQLGDWAHAYDYSTNEAAAKAAARDIREWLKSGSTKGWEGNSISVLDCDADAVGADVVTIDRDVDTVESLAAELHETGGAMAEALANALDPTPRATIADAPAQE